jgi:dTDP-4-amino-4,6-dideoxygalactose transaminase
MNKMIVEFFNYSKLLNPIKHELKNVFDKTLDHGKFILGPEVSEFEDIFSKKVSSNYSLGFSNGTDSLLAILMSLNLPENSEVIVPSFTFISTASVIVKNKLKPIFVDVEKDKFSPSLSMIKEKYSLKTSAVIFPHLFGEYNDLADLATFCKEKSIFLIEDCAQSFGTPNGNFGKASSYSFFPAKNLGCLGDGGAIATNDFDLYEKLKKIRTHGAAKQYQYEIEGGNFRLDTLQAAFLKVLIQKADDWIALRKENAKYYYDNLSNIENIKLPLYNINNTYNQFTILSKERDNLKFFLEKNGIYTNIYYPNPLHSNKIFNQKENLINTENLCKTCLSIPIYSGLKKEELEYIVYIIKKYYGSK